MSSYGLVKNILPKETCDYIEMLMFEHKNSNKLQLCNVNSVINPQNDSDVKWYESYNLDFLLPLLPIIKTAVEDFFDVSLVPTYTYTRILYPGTQLTKHVDRNSCEYSVSMTIAHNYSKGFFYPLYVEGTPLNTGVGDGVVYKGIEFNHWREPLVGAPNNYWIQSFFHYVDINDKNFIYGHDASNPQNESLNIRLKDFYV